MDFDIPEDAPRPRLCHLRKRPDFNGYGFNLHAEKGKSGQFIGKVDEGSPAHLTGLREGDRIIEVNGTNVGSENHQQVVQRIKAVPDETKFLVLDREADDYYRERKIVVRSDLRNVLVLETPLFHEAGANGTDLKHRPRLCHLKIWPEFTGYGFNLHAEKGKAVQYIGKVDKNSPAEAAGLREHDRIVEVNGFNVSGEAHHDVVKRIKSDPKQVTMLVVDKEEDAYFEKEGIVPSSLMHNVNRITCPDFQPHFDDSKHHSDGDKSEPQYKPRLCHIKGRGDGKGFGFNMQAEKGKPGQFIGKVDPGSPAQEAGLRDGDRLVEVNGISAEKDSHKDVVARIKSIPNETTLLVIEKEGYEYYSAKGVVVTAAMLSSVSRSSSSSDHKSSEENGGDEHHSRDEGTTSHKEADDDDQHILAAAAIAAAVEDERDESDDERRESREDIKVDDHNELREEMHGEHVEKEVTIHVEKEATMHVEKEATIHVEKEATIHVEKEATIHVEKEATTAHHDGDDHEVRIREENGSAVVKAAVVEAKAEEVAKKVQVEKKLEEKDEANFDYEDVADELTNIVESVEKEDAAKFEEKKPDKAALTLNVTSTSARVTSSSSSTSPSTSTPTPIESPKSPVVIGGIEFAGTAEEARRKMSKKRNVKDNSMSLKAKYDLFQKL